MRGTGGPRRAQRIYPDSWRMQEPLVRQSFACHTGAIAITQFSLEEFANWAARQALEDCKVRQALSFPKPSVGPLHQRRHFYRCPFSKSDERRRRFAPPLRSDSDHRRLKDRFMAHKLRFDVRRIDIEAAGYDEILAPVEEDQKAVLVEATDIPCSYKAPA